jgi:hypothetical protein
MSHVNGQAVFYLMTKKGWREVSEDEYRERRVKSPKLKSLIKAYISRLRDDLPRLDREIEVDQAATIRRITDELEFIIRKRKLP